LEQTFRATAPTEGEPIALDRLLADLDRTKMPVNTTSLKNDPPQIFYSASPAILLMVEGQPVLSPIEKTDLQFVVNTNWDLFFEKSKGDYYLLDNNLWLTSKNLGGPWVITKTLPKDMVKLPVGQNFNDVKKFVPPAATSHNPKTVGFSMDSPGSKRAPSPGTRCSSTRRIRRGSCRESHAR